MKKGTLKQNGVHLMDHEWNTVKYFLEIGKDIELLPRSEIKNYHQGDFVMDGVVWEAKRLLGKVNTLYRTRFRKQSSNLLMS